MVTFELFLSVKNYVICYQCKKQVFKWISCIGRWKKVQSIGYCFFCSWVVNLRSCRRDRNPSNKWHKKKKFFYGRFSWYFLRQRCLFKAALLREFRFILDISSSRNEPLRGTQLRTPHYMMESLKGKKKKKSQAEEGWDSNLVLRLAGQCCNRCAVTAVPSLVELDFYKNLLDADLFYLQRVLSWTGDWPKAF